MQEGGEATPKILATVREYRDLTNALADRIRSLGTTQDSVCELAGLPARYVTKLLSPRPVRSFGRTSLGCLLSALSLRLLVAEDPENLARLAPRMAKRKHRLPSESAAFTLQVSRRFMREIGRAGGRNSRRNLSRARKLAMGRALNRARWRNGGQHDSEAPPVS
jgi:hypothetical protein